MTYLPAARGALLLNLNAPPTFGCSSGASSTGSIVRAERYGLLSEIRLAGRITPI